MSSPFTRITDATSFFGNNTPQGLLREFGSPLYVYNENILRQRCRELVSLCDHPGFKVNYSAKANSNPALLSIMREEGCLVDAMSPGELFLNFRAGFKPEEILYVCNNVSGDELRHALDSGLLVSVDSLSQLDLLGRIKPGSEVMIRLNPGIGAGHHQKVITAGKATKFGISPDDLPLVKQILKSHNLHLTGLNQHIGSCFMTPDGYLAAAEILLSLADRVMDELDAQLRVIDFGGGFGIPYHKFDNEPRLDMHALSQGLNTLLKNWSTKTGYKGRFLIEPGRYISAECGILLGTVMATKHNGPTRYAGTDLGFNQLMRPILYDSYHEVEVYQTSPWTGEKAPWTVVGNICESGDILAKDRELPPLHEGDILGVLDAGAYGFVMASTYNQRPRPAEVLIQADGVARLIRRRETFEHMADLLA